MRRYSLLVPLLPVLLVAPALGANRQETSMPSACAVTDRSRQVRVLICDPGQNREVWQVAGATACAGETLCNAWIWDDRDRAPAKAPRVDAGLTAAQSRSAVAVWINDSGQLVIIKAAKRRKVD